MPWADGDALSPSNLNNKGTGIQAVSVTDSAFTGSSDASLFVAALSSLSVTGGTVLVPSSVQTYAVASTLTLYPNVLIEGTGTQRPTLQYSGTGDLFSFLGTSEAQGLNATLRNLQLVKSSASSGVGISAQNFANLYLENVAVSGFSVGVWTDYGIGLHVNHCAFTSNQRGILSGGSMRAGGIRAGSTNSAFMDTVIVSGCAFSQNKYDIADDGSDYALGGLTIRDSSFFESGGVSGKTEMVHVANRKGATITGNWFEAQVNGRTCLVLTNRDSFGTAQFAVRGALVSGNAFLANVNSGDAILVENADATVIGGNSFELGSSGVTVRAIRISDSTHQVTVLPNSYFQWHDGAVYPVPSTSSVSSLHLILDSNLTSDIGQLNVGFLTVRGGTIDQTTNTNLVRVYGGTNARVQLFPAGSSNSAFELDNVPVDATTPRLRMFTQGTVAFSLLSRQLLAGNSGTALQPFYAYSSESSLGLFRSANSTLGLSYGTFSLRGGILSSIRSTNASATSATLNDGEFRVAAVSTTSAELAYRSGNTTYRFIAAATAV